MRKAPLLAVCVLSLGTPTVGAIDLLDTYLAALGNDSTYLAARSALQATQQNIPLARANLLPRIALTGQQTANETNNRFTQANQQLETDTAYSARNAGLTLRQPLFRLQAWHQFSAAQAQVAAAEAEYEKERQAAALRAADAYFGVLQTAAEVKASRAELDAYTSQQMLADKAFSAGYGTRIDIHESQARLKQAQAQLMQTEFSADNARQNFQATVGLEPDHLADIDLPQFRPAPPAPATLEPWLEQLEVANPELASLRHQLEAARKNYQANRARHFPTADLVAGRQYGQGDTVNTIDRKYLTDYVGVQVMIPIFEGGGTTALIRQASATIDTTRHQFDAGLKRLSLTAQQAFARNVQGTLQIPALEQALEAAQLAVVSTERGIEAGTSTRVDVLNAIQRVNGIERDLSRARYEFFLSRFHLAAAVGALNDDIVSEINKLLQ